MTEASSTLAAHQVLLQRAAEQADRDVAFLQDLQRRYAPLLPPFAEIPGPDHSRPRGNRNGSARAAATTQRSASSALSASLSTGPEAAATGEIPFLGRTLAVVDATRSEKRELLARVTGELVGVEAAVSRAANIATGIAVGGPGVGYAAPAAHGALMSPSRVASAPVPYSGFPAQIGYDTPRGASAAVVAASHEMSHISRVSPRAARSGRRRLNASTATTHSLAAANNRSVDGAGSTFLPQGTTIVLPPPTPM